VERPGEGIAKLTLVTLEMTEQLIEALEELEGDEAVRAIVVTGAGDRAFCAGSDVKEFAEVRDRVVQKKLARENEAFGRFESLSKPTVAAVEGLAYGGGVGSGGDQTRREGVAALGSRGLHQADAGAERPRLQS
jgi:enoyl-CoA hydratase